MFGTDGPWPEQRLSYTGGFWKLAINRFPTAKSNHRPRFLGDSWNPVAGRGVTEALSRQCTADHFRTDGQIQPLATKSHSSGCRASRWRSRSAATERMMFQLLSLGESAFQGRRGPIVIADIQTRADAQQVMLFTGCPPRTFRPTLPQARG